MDISNVIGATQEGEDEHPHDEMEDVWRQFYHGFSFLDDMSGYKELDINIVISARRLEMEYFKKIGVYRKVKREEAKKLGGPSYHDEMVRHQQGRCSDTQLP